MPGEAPYQVLRVNRCCRVWVPEIILPAGKLLRQALEGESGANLTHLRKRFPDVKIIVSGDPSGKAIANQRLHVAAACKDKASRDRVASDLIDLVETACDLVADSLGLNEEQVQSAFEAIQVEKYSVHVERCDEESAANATLRPQVSPESSETKESGIASSAGQGILEMVVRRLELAMGGNDVDILSSAIEVASRACVRKELLEEAIQRKMELERQKDMECIDKFLYERQAAIRDLKLQSASDDLDTLRTTIERAVSVGVSEEVLEPAQKRVALLQKKQHALETARQLATRNLELQSGSEDLETVKTAIERAVTVGVCNEALEVAQKRADFLQKRQHALQIASQERHAAARDLELQGACADLDTLKSMIERAVSAGVCDEALEPARKRMVLLEKKQHALELASSLLSMQAATQPPLNSKRGLHAEHANETFDMPASERKYQKIGPGRA